MKSQIRFVMHPDDEAQIVAGLLQDPAVVLIDGPRWPQAAPIVTRDIASVRYYCLIWSPEDLAVLSSEYIPTCNDWYCRSEFATIQFLRCKLQESIICEGRFAVSSDHGPKQTAEGVDRRFKLLRRSIKKTFVNSLVCWRSANGPEAPAIPDRSADQSQPDSSLWVGPAAREWLLSDKQRRIKQFPTGGAEGVIRD